MHYTYRIRIGNRHEVYAKALTPEGQLLCEHQGSLDYKGEIKRRIQELHRAACEAELTGSEVKELGETLFVAMFDEGLRRHFFDCYEKVRSGERLLRVELDVDERELPDVAALPWEFMRVPLNAGHGVVWLGTDPNLILLRSRARRIAPKPIRLGAGERLRIVCAVAASDELDPVEGLSAPVPPIAPPEVAAPDELDPVEGRRLGPVGYRRTWEDLRLLFAHQSERIEEPKLITSASLSLIEDALKNKPHVVHFIGHAKLKDGNRGDVGQIRLFDDIIYQYEDWVDADVFIDLFTRYRPAVVILQGCETAALSASELFVGIASQVVEQNIPVVVGMQYKVSNSSAQRFTSSFYKCLYEGEPVDEAVQESRRFIAQRSSYSEPDFATPVLFMQVQDGHLFPELAEVDPFCDLPPHFIMNRGRQIDKLRRIIQNRNGAGIRIWGRPRAGYKVFLELAVRIMCNDGIKVLAPIDAGYMEDWQNNEFFVSALEARLSIPGEAEIVSANGTVKKIPRDIEKRLEKITVALIGHLELNPTAIVFFALDAAGEDTLRWLWKKIWIDHLKSLTEKGLWVLFFHDDTRGQKWWRSSPVEHEQIYMGDITRPEVSQFLQGYLHIGKQEADTRAEGMLIGEHPDDVYSQVEAAILKWSSW
jgi:hypothetical protein